MDAYLARLPRVVRHVSLLLQDRGFNPLPWTEDCDFVEVALERRVSIGELLTSRVRHSKDSAASLLVVFLDPIFDIGKGREVMTSSFQLHGALTTARPGEHTLIISFAKLSPDASREAAKLRRVATVMPVSSLAFPISQHVMIPKGTIVQVERGSCVAWRVVK